MDHFVMKIEKCLHTHSSVYTHIVSNRNNKIVQCEILFGLTTGGRGHGEPRLVRREHGAIHHMCICRR